MNKTANHQMFLHKMGDDPVVNPVYRAFNVGGKTVVLKRFFTIDELNPRSTNVGDEIDYLGETVFIESQSQYGGGTHYGYSYEFYLSGDAATMEKYRVSGWYEPLGDDYYFEQDEIKKELRRGKTTNV